MVDIGDSPAGPLLVIIINVIMYVCLYVYQKLLNATLSDLEILHMCSLDIENFNEGGILFFADRK